MREQKTHYNNIQHRRKENLNESIFILLIKEKKYQKKGYYKIVTTGEKLN